MTLYEELELTPNCSYEDIKHQYRTLAKIHHPDLGGDEEKFKRIKFAYEVLSDPERRRQYDENKTTSEQPSIHTEAINNLASIFFSIIPNFDCHSGNLIDRMKQEVDSAQNKTNADLIMCDVYIGNLEIVKKKLQLKNQNEEDIITSFVLQQLDARYNDKKMLLHRLDLYKEMLLILTNYNYGFLELVQSIELPSEESNELQIVESESPTSGNPTPNI